MAVLKNVPVKWVSVQKPNTKFEPVWSADVFLTPDQISTLQAEAKALHPKGLRFKEDEEGKTYFKFKRKVNRADGELNSPPRVVDSHGNTFTQEIGNGSICDIQYSMMKYDNKFGKGVVVTLIAVKVNNHVAFTRDEFEYDGDERAIAPASSKNQSQYDDDEF